MDIQKEHVIHLENGRFASGSSRNELRRILLQAAESAPAGGLVLHFHGGLVREKKGREIAEKLTPVYRDQGAAYPLFFVWESGVWETIWNNFGEISREKLFQELVKKVGEWVLKKMPAGFSVKGTGGGLINEKQLRKEFDDWFSGSVTTPPAMLSGPSPAPNAGQKGTELEEMRLAEQIEAALDRDFKTAVEAVYNGLEAKGQEKPVTKGVGSLASTDSLISPDAADTLFDRSPVQTKGLLSWAKVAMFVAKVVIACIKRMSSGRSHGIYPTLVEEVLRATYADKIGITLWNSMKRDTADAFANGEETGGFALLEELKALRGRGHSFTKITLIGHSTGAIYICHLLAAATRQLAGQQFDLIFLAPAVTHELFAEIVTSHRQLINNFRMFAMRDEVECQDSMVKILYTRSLLYFVSGLLESEADTPVVGMQRFINETDLFTPEKFPAITTVAAFFDTVTQSKVWSVTTGTPGTSSAAKAHGDFDDDGPTRDSMVHILKKGF